MKGANNCNAIDVQEAEELGVKLANNLSDYVLNFDLSSLQFDARKMYE